mgnify:CR=1 FL=1|tara:strand:+ start:77 stop:433 length:357 start_codon:yes stop_codon:yes gene_type:complete
MYYLKIISLEGCPYSDAVEQLVKNNNINSKIIKINQFEKFKYKVSDIETFPQIYLEKKYSSGSVLIGGYSKLKSYFDSIHSLSPNSKKLDILKNKINKENKDLSKKSVLRLIQLLANY